MVQHMCLKGILGGYWRAIGLMSPPIAVPYRPTCPSELRTRARSAQHDRFGLRGRGPGLGVSYLARRAVVSQCFRGVLKTDTSYPGFNKFGSEYAQFAAGQTGHVTYHVSVDPHPWARCHVCLRVPWAFESRLRPGACAAGGSSRRAGTRGSQR